MHFKVIYREGSFSFFKNLKKTRLTLFDNVAKKLGKQLKER